MKNNQRKQLIDDVIQLCIKKQWCEAESLFEKYLMETYKLWEQYDTLFNYQINKCGFCRKMKRAIVKQKWSEAERYSLINRLTCVNDECQFYLIFYSDKQCN